MQKPSYFEQFEQIFTCYAECKHRHPPENKKYCDEKCTARLKQPTRDQIKKQFKCFRVFNQTARTPKKGFEQLANIL